MTTFTESNREYNRNLERYIRQYPIKDQTADAFIAELKSKSANQIRNEYDKQYTRIENVKNDLEESIKIIDDNIKKGNECKILLQKMIDKLDRAFTVINNKKVGELQGLTKQFVFKFPNLYELDELNEAVLNQPYNEDEELSKINGGKKYSRKNTKK